MPTFAAAPTGWPELALRTSSTLAVVPTTLRRRTPPPLPRGLSLARELSGAAPADNSTPPTALRATETLASIPAPHPETPLPAAVVASRSLRISAQLAAREDPTPSPQPTPSREPAPSPEQAPALRSPPVLARPEARAATSGPVAQSAPPRDGPEDPVRPEDVRAGPPSPVSRETVPMETLPDLSALTTWAIPPIRWGGNTMSNYIWTSSEANTVFGETQGVNLRASSYIYQPWYAQVSGDLGLVTGSSKQSSPGGSSSDSDNTSISYGGNLSLFPQSRFPFQAYLSSSDSRAQYNAQTTQYTSTRMGARQSYRPETGPSSYQASADRSIVTASNNIRSIVDQFQGTASTTYETHALSGNARYSQTTGDIGGQGSSLFSVGASHSWRDEEELSLASSASYSSNEVAVLGGAGLTKNNSQMLQASTSANWIPDEDLPLTVTGGANLLNATTKTESAASAATSIQAYTNANYRFSPNLYGTAGVTMAHFQSAEASQFVSSQNASLSYVGTNLTFGDYSYSWGGGGGVTNQFASTGATSTGISGQAQHSIGRNVEFNELSNMSLTATQGYALQTTTGTGQSGTLTHSAGLSWRLGINERTASQFSATASDSLTTGEYSSHFRTLSAQGNLQSQLSSRSALAGNLNFVVSQQLSAPQPVVTFVDPAQPAVPASSNGTTNVTGSGQIAYSHRNPFDILNLLYTASFQVNASQTNLRVLTGDPNADAWQTGTVLQHSADYRIGRLVFRATNAFATLNGKKNASIHFSISREIGDL